MYMYVSLIYPHLYNQMDMQYSFLLFLLIFGMVTSSLSEDVPYSGRSVRENGDYRVPTPHNQQKTRERGKGTRKMIKNLKLERSLCKAIKSNTEIQFNQDMHIKVPSQK